MTVKNMSAGGKNLALGASRDDYIRIKVSDTGIGIAPENINSVFNPYFTTKGLKKGAGLGLAMVHGVVESYGGKITVESEVGKGSVFTLHFPIESKHPSTHGYTAKHLPTGKENILLVDDEESIVEVNSKLLESLGYSVTSFTSSIEALEAFRNRPDHFDLLLTDMSMPQMNGDKLSAELMKIRPDLPVILCTGYSQQILDDIVSKTGIRACAYKPITREELSKTVRKVLDRAKEKSDPPLEN